MAPYYVVEEQTKDSTILHPVKAKTKAQALAAITHPRFKVRTTDTDEVLSLTQSGAKVITAE